MDRVTINQEIAILLGFKRIKQGRYDKWVYPSKYSHLNSIDNQIHVPDFVGMIDEYNNIIKENNGSILDASLIFEEKVVTNKENKKFPDVKSGDMVKLTWKKDKFYGIDEIGHAIKIGDTMIIRFDRKDMLLEDIKSINSVDKLEVLTCHHQDLFQD